MHSANGSPARIFHESKAASAGVASPTLTMPRQKQASTTQRASVALQVDLLYLLIDPRLFGDNGRAS